MTDQLEQWMARLEQDHKLLAAEFHNHAIQPVHEGFETLNRQILARLTALETLWLKVGGSVIGLLFAILIALLGVLFTLIRTTAAVPPVHIP